MKYFKIENEKTLIEMIVAKENKNKFFLTERKNNK
jgi:hypothetical protein